MKEHFNNGVAFLEQEKVAKADLAKAPADQRDAAKAKVADLGAKAVAEFEEAQKSAPEKDPNGHLFWARIERLTIWPAGTTTRSMRINKLSPRNQKSPAITITSVTFSGEPERSMKRAQHTRRAPNSIHPTPHWHGAILESAFIRRDACRKPSIP